VKALVLCGGKGLRIRGDFPEVPKPLVPVHGRPLLAFILDSYLAFGVSDFILLVGEMEEDFLHFSHEYGKSRGVSVSVLQTGSETLTGGRIVKALPLMSEDERFFVTYGDGISNVNMRSLLRCHMEGGQLATLTAVRPRLPFGMLNLMEGGLVKSFVEKPVLNGYINGGFFVFQREAFAFATDRDCLETDILPQLSMKQQLRAYIHEGFWQNMDTYKDHQLLEKMDIEGAMRVTK
jgi:glucose-1-phosphate cytidylyltransferase